MARKDVANEMLQDVQKVGITYRKGKRREYLIEGGLVRRT